MHVETVGYLSDLGMEKIRAGAYLPPNAAYELGGKPFIDVLRARVQPADKQRLLNLIQDKDWWWHRYLGTNMSRPILDDDVATAVHAQFATEAHFHTKLAYVYLMLHALNGKLSFGATIEDVPKWLAELELNKSEFTACIHQFYSAGNPRGTWDSILDRWTKESFAGARAMYLLSLRLLLEEGYRGTRPEGLEAIASGDDKVLSPLANRLSEALAAS